MAEPIACRLSPDGARAQLGEWHALLGRAGASVERPSPTVLLAEVARGGVADAVHLAQREKACCPFFEFRLELEADRILLRIEVPADGADALDALVGPTASSSPLR